MSAPENADPADSREFTEGGLMKALAARLLTDKPAPQKPAWQVFIESTGGAALITVVVGGLVAGVLSQLLANRFTTTMRAQDATATAYKDYLSQGRHTLEEALGSIGKLAAACEDLLELSLPEWDPARYSDESLARLESQRREIRLQYNAAINEWRGKRVRLALLMGYYHDGQVDVITSWTATDDAVGDLIDCTRQVYLSSFTGRTNKAIGCAPAEDRLFAAVRIFTTARLAAARQQAKDPWH